MAKKLSAEEYMRSQLDKTHERAAGRFLPFFKFPEGKTDIRFLPTRDDDENHWFVLVGSHYNLLDRKPVTCPFETDEAMDDCPVCNIVRELRQDGMNDEANKISVRRQYLCRAIIRGQEEKGPQIVRLPTTLFQQIAEAMLDKDTWGDILDPGPNGRDIRVSRKGQNLQTEYSSFPLPEKRPVLKSKNATKEMIEDFDPLLSLVTMNSVEELERAVKAKFGYVSSAMGTQYVEEDDDDGDTYSGVTEVAEEEDDDWGSPDKVGTDVPFGGSEEVSENDEWIDEESIPDVSAMARKDQGLDTSVIADLKKDLGKKGK
jgi:hypothetical protein